MAKTISTRIQSRHDTTAKWTQVASTFKPLAGEIIIYDDWKSYTEGETTVMVPGIKIGNGNDFLGSIPFINVIIEADLSAHVNNSDIHVTTDDKAKWNSKMNGATTYEDGTLTFSNF